MSSQSPDGDDLPMVSVVVVTYNSAATVGETLASLSAQTYPSDRYELVVVDGGSSDGTEAVVSAYDAAFHVVEGGTIGACRNRGVDLATGEYVAFTDSDCAVPATWLATHVDRLAAREDDSIAGVGGPNRPFPDDPAFAKLVGSLQGTVFGSGGSPQSYAIGEVRSVGSVAACNVVYDAAVFESYRYDDSINVGEDAEFHYRLAADGYRFLFDPSAAVSHHLSADFGSFARKSRSYGNAMARIQRRHGALIRWYSPIPSLVLGGGSLAAAIDARARKPKYVPLLALAFLLVSAYATLQVYRDRRSPLAMLVPFLLAAQYACYGVGFVEGLIAPNPAPSDR